MDKGKVIDNLLVFKFIKKEIIIEEVSQPYLV